MAKEVTMGSILAKLTPEERMAIEQAQKSATALAKKKSVQRMLDNDDRTRIRSCLAETGCNSKFTLSNVRVLALRWVLDNHSNEFIQYLKGLSLHGEAKMSQNRPGRLATPPRQQVQQGSYPAGRGNQ